MASGITSIKDLFELLSYLIVAIGLPVAVYQYIRAVRKEQKDREYGAYDSLDGKYIEFQRLCLEYPHLDVWDLPDPNPAELDEDDKKRELILCTLLFSIFERAYLMYSDLATAVKRNQWYGWDESIRSYCARQNFRDAWLKSGETFDTKFEDYMNTILSEST